MVYFTKTENLMCKSMWTLLVSSLLLLLQPLCLLKPLTSLSHLIMGIFAHSSSASWEKLEGHRATSFTTTFWVWILFLWNHSFVVLLECFRSLNCCIIHFRPSFPDWWQEIVVKNLLIGLIIHGSFDNMQLSRSRSRKADPILHIYTAFHCWEKVPFLICSVGFSPNMVVWLWPNNSILNSSVQRMDFQKAPGLLSGKVETGSFVFFLSRGFHLATLPWL